MNITLNETEADERWCTTPFTTRTLKLTDSGKTVLFLFDIGILCTNLSFSLFGIWAVRSSRKFKVKPPLLLIFNLFANDIVFTVTAQSFYALKLFVPGLRCYYDLVFSFVNTWLSNASLTMVMGIALVRWMNTKYLFRTAKILTVTRAKCSIFLALTIALFLSSTILIGSIFNVYYLIQFPSSLSDVIVPIAIPYIYYRAMKISKTRRHASTIQYRSLTVETLRRCSFLTMVTFLPARILFFGSSTYKMINLKIYENPSERGFQLVHSVCYLIFCLSPVGNSLAYFLNNQGARRFMYDLKTRYAPRILYPSNSTIGPQLDDGDLE